MALGDLTKQLAEQAIAGTLRPQTKPESAPAAPAGEDVCATIAGEIQAMQKALKEDDELVVLYHAGGDVVRVAEVFLRSRNVMVLTGHDQRRTVTHVVANVEGLQLTCKVMKAPAGTKPARIGFIAPKAKP